VVVSAEQWLTGAVQRALSIGDRARYPELVGAIEALAACGAVSDGVARDAGRRLDETFSPAPSPRASDVRPPGDGPSVSGPQLEAALCPVVALADVDGVSVVLVAIELWTSTVIVRIAATGGPEADTGASTPGGTTTWWGAAGASRAEAQPPRPWGLMLLRLSLALSDDVGTTYLPKGGQAGGEPPWRAEQCFMPRVPASASRLTVAVERPEDSDGERVELELPRRR
jgi:hypothetical protein